MTARAAQPRPREDGNITLFTIFMVTLLLAAAGLVIDGGYTIAARQEASTIAEQAARAGADAVTPDSVRSGKLKVDPADGAAAAKKYLKVTGHSGSVTVGADAVTVTVKVTRQTTLLGAIGIASVTVTSSSTARAVSGIVSEE